ncbi:hypothetical protein ACWZU8_002905 [Vibrio cholerae]
MKYTKLLPTLLLLSPLAWGQITTFGTKNNTYNIDTSEIEDKLIRCPSTKDALPINFGRLNDKSLDVWYNSNVIIGKRKKEGFTESYSEIYADNNKYTNAYHYGYVFNKDYNYVSNNIFWPYLDGYSPYLTHTVYGSLYEPGIPGSDRLPLFISDTQFLKESTTKKTVFIPNKEFDVAEIVLTDYRYDIHSGKKLDGLNKTQERLYKFLRSDRYNSNILARVRIIKSKYSNRAQVSFWVGTDLATIYGTYNGTGLNKPSYEKSNIFKNVSYHNNNATGGFVIEDIRKVKDINFFFRKNSWSNVNPNGLWAVVNYRGERPWIIKDGQQNLTEDWNITDQMLKDENKYYEENKCFN